MKKIKQKQPLTSMEKIILIIADSLADYQGVTGKEFCLCSLIDGYTVSALQFTESQVREHISQLERKGYIKKIEDSHFDFIINS